MIHMIPICFGKISFGQITFSKHYDSADLRCSARAASSAFQVSMLNHFNVNSLRIFMADPGAWPMRISYRLISASPKHFWLLPLLSYFGSRCRRLKLPGSIVCTFGGANKLPRSNDAPFRDSAERSATFFDFKIFKSKVGALTI